MKILMVSMFANHFFNWTNQLKDSGHEVYWIDVFDNGAEVNKIGWVHQSVNWKRRVDFPGRQTLKLKFPKLYKGIQVFNERKLSDIVEKKIREIEPDIVQSFVLFSACAPILKVMNKYPDLKWVYSAWGNDLYFFQNDPDYLKDIRLVLPRVNYMFADCLRDYEIAKKYGFTGKFLGVYPGGGGYDFQLENEIKSVEERQVILIKGYQDLFGECIPVLKAIQSVKSQLDNFEIVVFGAEKEAIKYFENSELVNYSNFKLYQKIGRNEVMTLMGKSLIFIGNSISDGMPNTLLEAIIMGAFPIQSNPGGVTEEIIEDQKNGFLIQDPLNVDEISKLILKAINNKSFIEAAVEFNFKEVKPKLERKFVRQEVLKKYSFIENY
ncbi:glycosyltransferase [Christiangramia sp. SM2212]|uniref:Glycosyltransferase n=1 Tax=Christiangramia sediminicola TaxID=3073267 RepID=A0ABU1EMU2_9FLAO|nr:glycosyltransferase [Christiangramia sp. SM2212]MDR5589710.1 glycosyltransferase [Christiangramia sp. SM2212]